MALATITSRDDLAGWTEKRLLAVHSMGPKAVRILKADLQAQGQDFAAAPRPCASRWHQGLRAGHAASRYAPF